MFLCVFALCENFLGPVEEFCSKPNEPATESQITFFFLYVAISI